MIGLLSSQKLELMNIASQMGLARNDFEFRNEVSMTLGMEYLIISYKPNTNYSLRFHLNFFGDEPTGTLVPGKNMLTDVLTIPGHKKIDFHFVKTLFNEWAINLQREVPFDELWSKIQKGQYINEDFFNSNEKISAEESNLLRGNLSQLQLKVNSIAGLLEEQKQTINDQLEELKAHPNKYTKKEFYLMFMGVVFSWVMSFGLSPEVMKSIWIAVSQFLSAHHQVAIP